MLVSIVVPRHRLSGPIKRAFDISCALAGLLALSPVILITALVVKASSRGPALFSQDRVGLDGRLFRIYKFRSMARDAERAGTSVTAAGDGRITAVGRILRRTKIDELPQLINVLKGDMSLVGPRPDVPEIVAKYNPEMRHILSIRPGITSLATLHLRDEEGLLALAGSPDQFYDDVLAPLKVAIAMEHVRRSSFLFDLSILVLTVWMVTPFGAWWPVSEHPRVQELKAQLARGEFKSHE